MGIILGFLIICGIIWGFFIDLFVDLCYMEISNVYVILIFWSIEKDWFYGGGLFLLVEEFYFYGGDLVILCGGFLLWWGFVFVIEEVYVYFNRFFVVVVVVECLCLYGK